LEAEAQLEEHASISHKIRFKIIYLTEQRKLLDLNMQAVEAILAILGKCKENGDQMGREMYESMPIEVLRMIRKYLMQYQKQIPYIIYQQEAEP
jgi:hypothetical protein